MRILPITSILSLASHALGLAVTRLNPLFVAFAVPELLRRLYFWLQGYMAARLEVPSILPGWFDSLIYEGLTAVVFVAVIRYIVLKETPTFDPRSLPQRAVALIAIFLIAVWLPLDHLIDRHSLFTLYLDYNSMHRYSPDLAAGAHRVWLALGVVNFAVAVIGSALLYPMIGIIAVEGRADVTSWRQILRGNVLSLLLLATLTIAALLMAKNLYLIAVQYLFPALVRYAPASLSVFDWRLETLFQLRAVPLNYLFEVMPAVLVGLLMKGLLSAPQHVSP